MLNQTGRQVSISPSNTTSRSAEVGTAEARICVDYCSANICSLNICFFFCQLCVPQSSAVIKQLKGSVNWDDGIENEMNLCVSVRVGEYFGAVCGKKTPRQICRQRQMRLSGRECLCLHLEIVPHTSATPHCSFPLELHQRQEKFPAQVLCQGE